MQTSELARDWRIDLRAARRSEQTIRTYYAAVSSFVKHAGDDLEHLTRHECRQWLAGLQANSENTQRQYWIGMDLFCRWLVDEEVLDVSPMKGFQRPVAHAVPVEPYTTDEINRMLAQCVRKRHRLRDVAIITTLANTGMRVSELISMTVDTVDMDTRTIAIIGKGRKPRLVPFNDQAYTALRQYRRARMLKQYKGLIDYDNFWEGQRGPITVKAVDTMLKARAKSAGIADVHAHRFRHTFADRWLSDGGGEFALQTIAGWSSSSMLQRYTAARAADRAIAEYRKLNG